VADGRRLLPDAAPGARDGQPGPADRGGRPPPGGPDARAVHGRAPVDRHARHVHRHSLGPLRDVQHLDRRLVHQDPGLHGLGRGGVRRVRQTTTGSATRPISGSASSGSARTPRASRSTAAKPTSSAGSSGGSRTWSGTGGASCGGRSG
jgi:hypothetical protein